MIKANSHLKTIMNSLLPTEVCQYWALFRRKYGPFWTHLALKNFILLDIGHKMGHNLGTILGILEVWLWALLGPT